jgi:hypothetical protein
MEWICEESAVTHPGADLPNKVFNGYKLLVSDMQLDLHHTKNLLSSEYSIFGPPTILSVHITNRAGFTQQVFSSIGGGLWFTRKFMYLFETDVSVIRGKNRKLVTGRSSFINSARRGSGSLLPASDMVV